MEYNTGIQLNIINQHIFSLRYIPQFELEQGKGWNGFSEGNLEQTPDPMLPEKDKKIKRALI